MFRKRSTELPTWRTISLSYAQQQRCTHIFIKTAYPSPDHRPHLHIRLTAKAKTGTRTRSQFWALFNFWPPESRWHSVLIRDHLTQCRHLLPGGQNLKSGQKLERVHVVSPGSRPHPTVFRSIRTQTRSAFINQYVYMLRYSFQSFLPDRLPCAIMNVFLVSVLLALSLVACATAQSCSRCHSLGFPPASPEQCNGSDCVIYDVSSQSECEEKTSSATRIAAWKAGLSRTTDMEVLKGKIVAYKIQWFSGGWSKWYVPGVNDIDHKVNLNNGACGMRRFWSYFFDHNHQYIICK